ncbi:AAA family ATPase [Alkaliphilus serpentinus]|uniref:AAA family ATPase n=1 Tax=Alkaliphilus serpentinus TaxID=1482731 RepID=A0A833HRI9_9FIRM|nr:AAA family ATPase [Alkaliphilus serpentinus]KAB3533508.1 AAA family ATPase [Alkaliphilus serpentinus]
MKIIQVKLFNTPTVIMDNHKVLFPFRKAEALFFYLVCNKREATRDELVNLLWADVPEDVGKKNLRNTMYKIRKAFNLDIIISPQKSVVMLNPDIHIEADIDTFLLHNSHSIKAYTGDFLQGFSLKEGEAFEEWMYTTRELYKDLYIALLYNEINKESQIKGYEIVEQYCKLIMTIDPFDERPYRILMNQYMEEGAYNKGIEIYNRLEKILEKEMGIKPDGDSKKILEKLIDARNIKKTNNSSTSEGFFFGREMELKLLMDNFNHFSQGKGHKSVIITGEAGIGKTNLKEKFLTLINHKDLFVFQSNCYQAEEDYVLKPWNPIFARIKEIIKEESIEIPIIWSNIISYVFPVFAIDQDNIKENLVEELDYMQFKLVEDAISGLIGKLCQNRKILLIFDDIQWMDNRSIALLKHLLHQDKENRILLVGISRNEYDIRTDSFITLLNKYNLLEEIKLERFTAKQVEEFMQAALPNRSFSRDLIDKIFTETEGNTFFIVEYLNALRENRNFSEMSSKLQDIIKSRFLNISQLGKRLLDIISLFFDKASMDIIKDLLGIDEMELLEAMEELENKYLISETSESDKIAYQFTHQKLREFIYNQLSPARRKFLHNRIGQILEKQLKGDKSDILSYSRLIYHFSSSGNLSLSLKYQIKNLNAYLDYSHELFPVISENYKIKEKSWYLTSDEALKSIKVIEESFNQIQDTDLDRKEYLSLKIAFQHMQGRYLIRQGDYEKGIKNIMDMIGFAEDIGDQEYILKGYRQLIYYGIQTHATGIMEEYIEKALKLADEINSRTETAILLRLKGLSKIMALEYVEAEEILQQAIHLFEDISKYDDKYILNVAAVYNYLGEIRRYNMKFSSALKYYDRAMAICAEKKVTGGLTIFNTNAGQAAFDMGDYERAKTYFNNALKLYQQFDLHWGRSIAEGYMTILNIKEGQYKKALERLKKAEECSERMKNPYEKGLVYRVKAEIKANMENSSKLNKVFSKALELPLKEYCDKGIHYLSQIKGCYEAEILAVLKKNDKALQ